MKYFAIVVVIVVIVVVNHGKIMRSTLLKTF